MPDVEPPIAAVEFNRLRSHLGSGHRPGSAAHDRKRASDDSSVVVVPPHQWGMWPYNGHWATEPNIATIIGHRMGFQHDCGCLTQRQLHPLARRAFPANPLYALYERSRVMTVRHRYATWSKFVVSSVVALAVVVGLGLPGTHAEPVQIAFQVLDGQAWASMTPSWAPSGCKPSPSRAARWGSFFVSAFPGETVPVGIRFGPLADFLAFSHTFHLDTGDVSTSGALAEHLVGGDVLPGLDGEIIFSEQAPFFLGTTGQPASTQYDFVTFAMHELGHLFGFTSFHLPRFRSTRIPTAVNGNRMLFSGRFLVDPTT